MQMLGNCAPSATVGGLQQGTWDCGFLGVVYNRGHSIGRKLEAQETDGIQKDMNTTVYLDACISFGSWHAGVCNFVFGDGSVHGVSIATAPSTLDALEHTSDGASVSLP
ncbi:hypothetical protein FACS1894189_2080 [Planctomycetales bacterium]|nr:hypothetical protein FACS1894189_2080 [Planctomycetales bacterium]